MLQRALSVTSGASANRAVIRVGYSGPAFRGSGTIDYVCPECRRLVSHGTEENQVFDVVVVCGGCRSRLEFPRWEGTALSHYVVMAKGVYQIADAIVLRPGVSVVGVGMMMS